MRVVIAPDKLRGTYTADEAAAALARGWQEVRLGDDIVEVPLADGGEGTAAALLRARGGEWREADVHDALGPAVHGQVRPPDRRLGRARRRRGLRVGSGWRTSAATRSAPRRAAPGS